MAMDPLLVAAIRAGEPTLHLVAVTLPAHTIRWTDGGFAFWDGHSYLARDATYGVLDEIGDITDGVDDDGSPVPISVLCPTLEALADLAAMDAQGGQVTIHLAALDGETGVLIGEPYRLHIGELDQPRLIQGPVRKLEYDVITADARALQPNEEQRQTDAFHKLIWGSEEKGNEYATDGTKWVYWREDEPRQAIGVLTGRGKQEKDDKRLEFTYEPTAPFVFPMGRCAIGGGAIRYRVGYGPTNRYQTVFATFGASGPIKDLVKVTFDDEDTSFDASDRATNGAHAGEMWFKWLPGDQPSAALTSPTGTNAHSSAAPGWTPDHTLSGRPCFAWTGKENSKKTEYGGGIPKPVLTVEGLFGWDPRAEGCDLAVPSTWVWPEDGATWALNWIVGRWEGPSGGGLYGVPYDSVLVGGIGSPLDLIDIDAFSHAADVADANGWTVSAAPYSDADKIEVLEDLLQAAGAQRIRKCGLISCMTRGEVQASVLTATAADTAGRPEISLGPSRLDRKNTAVPSFVSEANRWEITPATAVTDATWQTEDGGRQTTGFTYKYAPLANQAAQLAYLDLADRREKVSAQVPMKLYMLQLEPGDCFTWDEPEYLLDGVKVRVLKRTYSPRTRALKLAFRQETDAKVAAALAQAGTAPTGGEPGSPPTDVVDDPTAFTATVDGDEVTLEWTVGETNYFRTLILISDSNVFSTATQIASRGHAAGSTQTFVHKPGPGTWYYWVQGRSYLFELSEPAGPEEAIVTMGAIPEAVADASNLLRRAGGGLYEGDLDATEGAAWDSNVSGRPANLAALAGTEPINNDTLEADLLSAAVIPAEAVTFTGKGDLAVLNEVDTPEIVANAVTDQASAVTSASQTLTGTTAKEIQTVTYTATGEPIEVRANFFMTVWHPAGGDISANVVMTRDGLGIIFNQLIVAIGGDYIQGWQTPIVIDTPPAGSVTYRVSVTLTNNAAATETVEEAFLGVREYKR